ncbi:uncharacterized protein AAES06_002787 isoform 1-T2 [Glossophaga mutica]
MSASPESPLASKNRAGAIGEITSQSVREPEGGLICVLGDGPENAGGREREFVRKEERAALRRGLDPAPEAGTPENTPLGSPPPHFGSGHGRVACRSVNPLQRFGRNASRGLLVGQESLRRRKAPHLWPGGGWRHLTWS